MKEFDKNTLKNKPSGNYQVRLGGVLRPWGSCYWDAATQTVDYGSGGFTLAQVPATYRFREVRAKGNRNDV